MSSPSHHIYRDAEDDACCAVGTWKVHIHMWGGRLAAGMTATCHLRRRPICACRLGEERAPCQESAIRGRFLGRDTPTARQCASAQATGIIMMWRRLKPRRPPRRGSGVSSQLQTGATHHPTGCGHTTARQSVATVQDPDCCYQLWGGEVLYSAADNDFLIIWRCITVPERRPHHDLDKRNPAGLLRARGVVIGG